jgi:hypothetical protein
MILAATVDISENALYGLVVAITTPVLGFVMWKVSRPHTEQVEDSNALATTIAAIGDAAVHVVAASTDVSEMMHSFMEPLRQELEFQKLKMAQLVINHDAEIESLRAEFVRAEELCAYRLDILGDHVKQLRQKMRANGIDPGAPPELQGFEFD